MNRLLIVSLNEATVAHLTKDAASFAYYLGKNHGWDCNFAYFNPNSPIDDAEFERYCQLTCLGNDMDYDSQMAIASEFIIENIRQYDVLMLYNYGSATYKLAKVAKRANSDIKVWSKLDMGNGGFGHFYDGTLLRSLKASVEIWKTRNIDLFTVETKAFYNVFKQLRVFRGRIRYLPNCVSMFKVNKAELRDVPKENIIITVGRLGDWCKDNELFIDALALMEEHVPENWKVYMVGPVEDSFQKYAEDVMEKHPHLRKYIVFTGAVYDRTELYKLCARAKIICMTSRSESTCIATFEAMWFGAVPVLTDYGAIVEDATDNRRFGSVMQTREPNELAKLLELNMNCQEADRDDIRKYIRENFSYDLWAEKLSEYLRQIL